MNEEEAVRLVQTFLEANPQSSSNQWFSITVEGTVEVMHRMNDNASIADLASDVIALACSDDQGNVRISPAPGTYEKMYFGLLGYQFGNITFLEMLAKWENILGITSFQSNPRDAFSREE